MAPGICQAVESEQTAESLTLSDRRWRCGGCGAVNDRDANAALNLETWPCEFPESLTHPGSLKGRPLGHFSYEVLRWRTGRLPEWTYRKSSGAEKHGPQVPERGEGRGHHQGRVCSHTLHLSALNISSPPVDLAAVLDQVHRGLLGASPASPAVPTGPGGCGCASARRGCGAPAGLPVRPEPGAVAPARARPAAPGRRCWPAWA